MLKKKYLQLIAILIPSFLAFISLCRDCNQDKTIENIIYQENAMKYRPILKIIGTPSLMEKNIEIQNMSVDSTSNMGIIKMKFDSLKVNYKLVNTGSSIERIVAAVSSDTISYHDFLREFILGKRKNMDISKRPFKEFREVHPNDSTIINITHGIRNIEYDEIILHLLILYENDIGSLYDTYYWTKCIFSEGANLTAERMVDGVGTLYWDRNILVPKKTIQAYEVYNKEETKSINDFLYGK